MPLKPRWNASPKVAALVFCGALLATTPSHAQPYERRGTMAAGAGITSPVGDINEFLNASGAAHLAGGLNLSPRLTLQVEWTHNWLAVDPAVIDRASSDSVYFDNAHASLWSFTLNGVYRFRPNARVVPWVTGGFGFYKRNVQLTQNAMVYYPPIYDDEWGWIGGGWQPGEVVTGTRESGAFGYNLGFGFDFPIEEDAAMFIDLRFHHALTDGIETMVVPITAGVRW